MGLNRDSHTSTHVKLVYLWGAALVAQTPSLAPAIAIYPHPHRLGSNCLVLRLSTVRTHAPLALQALLSRSTTRALYPQLGPPPAIVPVSEVIAGRNIDQRRTTTVFLAALWRPHHRRGPEGLEQPQPCRGDGQRS